MSEKNHKGVAVEETSRRLSDASTLVPVKEDEMQRFTATGRPLTKHHNSGVANPSTFIPEAPPALPWKFTDSSMISVPIPVLAREDGPTEEENATGGLGSKLKQAIKGKKAAPKMRVVKMTRAEYLKYWARDEQGNYIGTEPEGSRDSDSYPSLPFKKDDVSLAPALFPLT
ncbi:MAG: hypothetical protein M1816_002673 [Peltula sp. TS41687]|nr:MAG: hypothetical protein M1816_002673 [Peltula sp. TS41687]